MAWIGPGLLAAISVVIVALAWHIRRGATWMLSGYRSERVVNASALARWVGTGVLRIGISGVVAAGLLTLFPAYMLAVIGAYFVGVIVSVVTLVRGAARFVVSDGAG